MDISQLCVYVGGQVEIGRILSFQAQNLQFSNPYIDDYYFQAHAKKHQKGLNRFAPAMLRLRDPSMKQGRAEVRFADLEGLGKIPFSNLRTPRPLIDFAEEQPEASLTDNDGNTAQTAGTRSIKPLHMEQMLHARKVISQATGMLGMRHLSSPWATTLLPCVITFCMSHR